MSTPETPRPDAPAAPGPAPEPAPAEAPAAAAAPAAAPDEAEAEAWARVVAAWDDEGAHRAYLARFADLEGLAVAGGRYRAVLAERPGDPTAARLRDEVVKRATVQGLASLPRTVPRQAGKLHRRLVVAALVALGAAAAWAAFRLAVLLTGSPS
ncbi:conserved hypothetical protein [Anaeromyxobacter dehalogenans 2CP-1]|uniref:Uncharacterized protein n=1 Tax=Anaeromyxobacter dehalogenans (strain ATCC BAA-258 / DSM 21875 / 2CP-1) TaxID=455488 RepID=B8JCS6_ANAD2|nr:hypothetical protein [Anaeromyxobacter dehalogenans]ACL67796.1 conserved hypothetical protein [Anaeromyxobacter dehalogenans 2CP-1]